MMNTQEFLEELRKIGKVETMQAGKTNKFEEGLIAVVAYEDGPIVTIFQCGKDDYVIRTIYGVRKELDAADELKGVIDIIKTALEKESTL
jgi:hypothetical protein